MAIQGVSSKEVIEYVPEDDRESKVEEQTVFHLKPKRYGDGNRSAARYMSAQKTFGRAGFTEIDPKKMDKADLDTFLDHCIKVENYIFSPDYDTSGKPTKVIIDSERLKEVWLDMGAMHQNEVLDVIGDMTKLRAGEKKSSNSLSTSTIGKVKQSKDDVRMTATSVEK